MSLDLYVYLSREVSIAEQQAMVRARKGYEAQLGVEGDSVQSVERVTAKQRRFAFSIDGPVSIELDDVPEVALARLLSPKAMYLIRAPRGRSAQDAKCAQGLARAMAKAGDGVVYDPQGDSVVWPKSRPSFYRAPVEKERADAVELEWSFPVSGDLAATLASFFGLLQRHLAECVPRRFGDSEPPRFQYSGESSLAEMESLLQESLGWVYWFATSPCLMGSVSLKNARDQPRPRKGRFKLCIKLDGRALNQDHRWVDASVALFLEACQSMQPIYAAASVSRNHIARRRFWSDGKTERYQVASLCGLGLPRDPSWLTWFGPEYTDRLGGALPECERMGDSLYWRGGELPMNRDELHEIYPKLPEELLVPNVERPFSRVMDGAAEWCP